MSYYFTKTITGEFKVIENRVIELLKNEGFGVLTQIDMQQTLKDKLNVGFKKYKILGACNPSYALKALKAESKVGVMLPCNIIIQEHELHTIEVSAINPLDSMQAVHNDTLNKVAREISYKLENVINNLEDEK